MTEDASAAVIDLSMPHRVFSKADAAAAAKWCELLKRQLRGDAVDLIRRAEGRPILYSYQADATPVLVRTYCRTQVVDGLLVHRSAGEGCEFLVERAFLKSTDRQGKPLLACLMRDPRPLTAGKASWNVWTACREFFPPVRSFSHGGIVLSHFAFDRALFQPVLRKLRQQQARSFDEAAPDDPHKHYHWLLDWICGTGCIVHDIHNGLRWGLTFWAPEPAVVKDMHVCIESLRHSYDLVLGYLKPFVLERLTFVDTKDPPQAAYSFWVSLGIESSVAEELADLGVRMVSSRLTVHSAHRGSADLVQRLTSCMIYIFCWRQFVETRWMTVGVVSRALIASLSIGLAELIEMISQQPGVSQYYIGGFSRLTQAVRHYATVAAVASFPCDALLGELLEDDRLLRRAEDLKTVYDDEIEWIACIGDYVWSRLSSLLQTATAASLRDDCLRAACAARAYIDRKVFNIVRTLPFSLAVGLDVQRNLTVLSDGPEPVHDDMSAKLWHLMRCGFNVNALADGVKLLREIHWSTVNCEQGHGSTAIIHKYHRQYSKEMLSQRAFLHMCRPLFMLPTEAARLAREEHRFKRLRRRRPERITGRHIYLGELMTKAKDLAAGRQMTTCLRLTIMEKHAEAYKELSVDRRQYYEALASKKAKADRDALNEEVELSMVSRDLAEKRRRIASDAEGLQHRLDNCRFTKPVLDSLALSFSLQASYSPSMVRTLREAALRPPEVPSASVQHAVSAYEVDDGVPLPTMPSWCKQVCRFRDLFAHAAIVVITDSSVSYHMFLFALQNPLTASFLVLHEVPVVGVHFSGSSFESTRKQMDDYCERMFTVEWSDIVEGHLIEVPAGARMYVLPQVAFKSTNFAGSHADLVCFDDFIGGSTVVEDDVDEAPQRSSRTYTLDGTLVQQHPWLAKYKKAPSAESVDGDTGIDAKSSGDEHCDEETLAAAAFAQLEEKRAQLDAEVAPPATHFRTVIRGGAWTQQRTGMAFDSIRSQPHGSEAHMFVRKYRLPSTGTFAYRLYGNQLAEGLANLWCARMQYYFDIRAAYGTDTYAFTPEDHAAAPSSTDELDRLLLGAAADHCGKVRKAAIVAAIAPH